MDLFFIKFAKTMSKKITNIIIVKNNIEDLKNPNLEQEYASIKLKKLNKTTNKVEKKLKFWSWSKKVKVK
tara:strand:+ start:351 stop:560 length:210 start_codon:yes stop_codon:yes gene_type:complete